MFKKLMNNLANAGTLAFMGYEIGSQVNSPNKEDSIERSSIVETVKLNTNEENHSEIIIIVGIIIMILILAAIASKILCAKNRLV